MEKRVAQEDDDVFHFVAYVPHDGRLYELDGLRKGPIDHGACSREEWLSTAVPVIQKRMEKYAGGEIRFNLLAVRGVRNASATGVARVFCFALRDGWVVIDNTDSCMDHRPPSRFAPSCAGLQSVMAQAQERMEEIQAQLLSIGQESEAAAVLVCV